MVAAQRLAFQLVIVILIKINVQATRPGNKLGLLSKFLGKQPHGPVYVIIKKSSNPNPLLRTSDNQNQKDADEGAVKIPIDETVDDEKTKRIVKDILRSTGDKNDPVVQKANLKFENALRARCEAYIECKIKCPPQKKKKDKCKKSCKDVYDYLMICNPPGGKKKKKKKDSCEGSDECGNKKKKKKKPKDSCEESDECGDKKKKPKDSCEESDECGGTKEKKKPKDSCEESDECKPKPKNECKSNRPNCGKTMPPTWRF